MTIRPGMANCAPLAAALLLVACSTASDAPLAPHAAASIAVSGFPAHVLAGDVVQLTATATDARNLPVADPAFTWSASNDGIATVSPRGLVTVLGHGSVTITASVNGRSASVTSLAALTLRERRFAYTLVPANAPPTGPAAANLTENASGGDVSIGHPSPGDYIVTFERLARADTSWRETVMLTMSPGSATHCHVNDWRDAANGRDLEVSVSCYATDNRKANGSFSVLVVGGGSLEGRHSFVYSPDSSQSYSPPAAAVFNSSGQAVAVNRVGSGSYRVDVNNPRTTGAENFFITTIGNPSATCVLGAWSYGSYGNASCVGATGSVDARFAMQLIEGGRRGRMFGFAWASSPTQALGSEYVPSPTYQRMSNGREVAITRTTSSYVTSGVYDVRFPGFGPLVAGRHSVQVSSYSSGRVSCAVAGQSTVTGNQDLVVRVNCYDRYSATPTNAYFTVLVIE